MQVQGNAPKFKCLSCDMTFMRSYKLRVHERMKHTLDKPFQCLFAGCKWAFTDAYKLKNHENTHLKLKEHRVSIWVVKGLRDTSSWHVRTRGVERERES